MNNFSKQVADSPCLSRDFKDDEITPVKNGDNDQKHQEQEADEEHNSLNGHSCQYNTETGHFCNEGTCHPGKQFVLTEVFLVVFCQENMFSIWLHAASL